MKHNWEMHEPNPVAVEKLADHTDVTPLLACCLVNRKLADPEIAQDFLKPKLANLGPPEAIPNLGAAVSRLLMARKRNEQVVVFGDYDVDGVTSTTLLLDCLGSLGWNMAGYLPNRMDEGYGLTAEGVDNCLREHQPDILLATDCGSTSFEIVRSLQGRGIDVIVLDHHQVSEPPPPAYAIVNPQLAADDEPDYRELCSAGLAFKLVHGLLKAGRQAKLSGFDAFDIRRVLDLVALGTIADLVPLVRENRILAVNGLKQLNNTTRIGIAALVNAAGISGAIGGFEVGFQLAPRLNAAGRLKCATMAMDLLREKDPQVAEEMAGKLDLGNRERQKTERAITLQVTDLLQSSFNRENDFAIVQGDPDWHIGVVGIVASRVQKKFYRPTIILGGGPSGMRGSGRSVEGFDLAAALRECDRHLDRHGGHAMAAGLSIQPQNINAFRKQINEIARSQLSSCDLMPTLILDAQIPLSELNLQTVKSLDQLQPTGQGVSPVQVVVPQLELAAPIRWMGKEKQHAKLNVTDGKVSAEAVYWNAAGIDLPGRRFDIAAQPTINSWRGRYSMQLKILDWRPAL
jgi:single-stranded-DNA-specific exonuclease